MDPQSHKMTMSKAFFACCCVFLGSVGFCSKASASCGDYLRHKTHTLSKAFSIDARDSQSGQLPVPSTGCKNGNCGEAPPALPLDPVRSAKLDANHFNSEFGFAPGMSEKFEFSNEKSPLQPSLDLPDPPPRAIAL